MSKAARSIALLCILVPSLMLVSSNRALLAEQQQQEFSKQSDRQDQPRYRARPSHDGEGYVLREVDGQVKCADSVPGEIDVFTNRDPRIQLRQITHVGEQITAQQTGLTIILRATAQLDANATAKAAFIAAAARWEAIIRNPITVVIDVDYGPTRFGVPYPGSDVLGATLSQRVGDSLNYLDTRSRLVAGASSPAETTLYGTLPSDEVTTDIGTTEGLLAPSALFRAIGSLPPVADPINEQVSLGSPPGIGFNSAFTFDFDPENGITTNTTDFDAVAVHEIGHVLGFSSMVGSKESTPSEPVFLSVLDMFRFRPGVTMGTFPTAQRILSSGGEHRFFGGGAELALSTGRPNGTAGDGRQSSHWKDDQLSGTHIGIMDPTIARGERETITANDVAAFNLLGYNTEGVVAPQPEDAVALTSGVGQPGTIGAPSPGSGVLGGTQFSIQVPAGTTQLKIDLSGDQDVDLLVRYGTKIVIDDGAAIFDHVSDSLSGTESITIVPSTTPPLRTGTYFIGIGNFGPGAASFTVTATVTTGGGGGGGSAPAVSNLAGSLNGDVLTLTGSATDSDGDMIQGQSSLLDEANQVVATSQPFNVTFGSQTSVNFTIGLTNLNLFPSALKATLVLIDGQGNRSPSMTADFSQADAGGPTIKKVSLSGSKLVIKGKDLAGSLTIEINGVDVITVNLSSSKKAKVSGISGSLRAGPNRIRVRHGTTRSNIFVFTQ
jgi:hypothetical protein